MDPAHLGQAALLNLPGAPAAMEFERDGIIQLPIADGNIYELISPHHSAMGGGIEIIGEVSLPAVAADDIIIDNDTSWAAAIEATLNSLPQEIPEGFSRGGERRERTE